jgi:polyphosphate:AMP phosphotransferase
MLNKIQEQSKEHVDQDEAKKQLKLYRQKLERQQQELRTRKLPVIVLFEGWGAAGKGSAIGRLIYNLDPRFFSIAVMEKAPSEEESRRPFLYRFFKEIPEAGQITLFDSGWMEQTIREKLTGVLFEREYEERVESINVFERQLTDNGYLLVKLFLHISEKEQRQRLRTLSGSASTSWRVNQYDRLQNKHYGTYLEAFDQYLTETDHPYAPWHIVDSSDKKMAELQAIRILTDSIEAALENGVVSAPPVQNVFPLKPMPKLAEVALNKALPAEDYKKQMKKQQERLRQLHNELYHRRTPVIILYEGWDAAGKGGNIRRVAEALDPRGYEVFPIASPEPHEKSRHYLWRFWTRLPKDGHIAILDRTWYGRVMVERIEGFCSEADWKRAYNEINEFEKELTDWGAVVIKFWLHIDQETQLQRFTDRQNTPEKRWKITDEDWRNREKWPAYEEAVDEMLQKTSTGFAPWDIIESCDKPYARVKTLKIIADRIERVL